MNQYHVYQDIENRTGGDIYLGVVGPVRTGKSTFIKRFMEQLVLPKMEDEHARERTRDELPQSSAGKTIMTTEPKFIPKEAASLELPDGAKARVRLIDCVGFMADGAAGHVENGQERMVKTPWFPQEIPFTQAAEIGTRKVISDHSNIGIVVTADGSFGELPHSAYRKAEETAVRELKEIGKPFLMLLNSARPCSPETLALAGELSEHHGVTVLPVNCEQLKSGDITRILELALKEFPVTEADFEIPRWLELLPSSHWLKAQVIKSAVRLMEGVRQMKDVPKEWTDEEAEQIRLVRTENMDFATGKVRLSLTMQDGCYYRILSDYAGLPITDEYRLMQKLKEFSAMQKEYRKVAGALSQVRHKGYGVVTPDRSEIVLDEPEVIRHGSRYGVKMRAEAPSVSLIRARIRTEIAPIVGTEEQAKDLIAYMKENAKNSEDGIWETGIFGKSIGQIVEDGIQAKVSQMTEDCQQKLQDALQKIINDSNGGIVCIII